MSANVPYKIQEEIVKRVVPVKSLLRFRSVSKQWKSLIDNPEFITHHTLNMQTQPHHLLVTYTVNSESKCVSFVDDDSFPHNKFYYSVPPIIEQFRREGSTIIGCSHGLLCLRSFGETKLLVIWNPSVRKHVCIKLPDTASYFGFGVCPKTGDPKIVQLNTKGWKAEVFSLSSRVWRSVPLNLPRKEYIFAPYTVVIDGIIYWSVSILGYYVGNRDLVISFDMTSEEFGEVELPYRPKGSNGKCISKLNECLVVIYYSSPVLGRKDCYAWKMFKNGSFTKLFTFDVQGSYGSKWDYIIGFRKNGQPIIERQFFTALEDHRFSKNGRVVIKHNRSVLEVYDKSAAHNFSAYQLYAAPYFVRKSSLSSWLFFLVGAVTDAIRSLWIRGRDLIEDPLGFEMKHQKSAEGFTGLGISGLDFQMTSYTESLLLLKHDDSVIG